MIGLKSVGLWLGDAVGWAVGMAAAGICVVWLRATTRNAPG
ncbi:MAG: hypothetical protein ACRDPR_11890 [Nocardioidaceae bacterium]